MTYKELIKACYETPREKCRQDCEYCKECNAFEFRTGYAVPNFYIMLDVDFDSEIEAIE